MMDSFTIKDGHLTKYGGYGKKVCIPQGVTYIDPCVFTSAIFMEEVIIPSGVTGIGDHAFSDCTRLKKVTLPGSIRTIREKAFRNCYELVSVSIADRTPGDLFIGYGVFEGCRELTLFDFGLATPYILDGLSATVPQKIYAEDIYFLEAPWRPAALLGFAEDGDGDLTSPRGESHANYFAANETELIDFCIKNIPLLDFIIGKKLITENLLEHYIETAINTENIEAVSILLDYKNSLN